MVALTLFSITIPPKKNWTYHNETSPTGAPSPRSNALVVAFLDTIYVHGGECGGNVFNDTWMFSPSESKWTLITRGGPTLTNASAAVASNGTMYVFGGSDGKMVTNQLYAFDLTVTNANWTNITPKQPPSPSPRQRSSLIASGSRLFLFGGYNGTYLNDTWQLVIQKDCKGFKCEDCIKSGSCGWCMGNTLCIVGSSSLSAIDSACKPDQYTLSAVRCPEEGFPSWAIALIVIGGVVLIGIIVFAIMKVRSGRQDYSSI